MTSRESRGDPIGTVAAAMYVLYSPAEQTLATVMMDHTVRLWDMSGLG
ncbi:hypothetical protein [Amycolatopsis sp. lyj-108]